MDYNWLFRSLLLLALVHLISTQNRKSPFEICLYFVGIFC